MPTYSFRPVLGTRFVVIDTVADNSELREHRRCAVPLARVAARGRGRRCGSRPRLRPPLDRVDVGAGLRRPAWRRGRGAPAPTPPRARVRRRPRAPEPDRARPDRGGGFWEIVTASHLDWPQQARVIELADLGDDAFAIYTTAVDHLGPPVPPAPRRPSRIARPPQSSASPRSRGSCHSTTHRRRTATTAGPTGAARALDRNTALVSRGRSPRTRAGGTSERARSAARCPRRGRSPQRRRPRP